MILFFCWETIVPRIRYRKLESYSDTFGFYSSVRKSWHRYFERDELFFFVERQLFQGSVTEWLSDPFGWETIVSRICDRMVEWLSDPFGWETIVPRIRYRKLESYSDTFGFYSSVRKTCHRYFERDELFFLLRDNCFKDLWQNGGMVEWSVWLGDTIVARICYRMVEWFCYFFFL